MKIAQFERFYGNIRKLGRAQIEREQPHILGQSIAETLYYRGFIGEGFDKVDDNLIGFIFVPNDLIAALPLHKTSYETLDDDNASAAKETPALGLINEVDDVSRADTAIVDDLTTMLASLQTRPAAVDGEQFAPEDAADINTILLQRDESRLWFMLGIAESADLVFARRRQGASQTQRGAKLAGGAARPANRAAGESLAGEPDYREMWHIPGLYPEDSGWSYDAAAARKAVMQLLADLLPEQGWVSVNDLIEIIKEFEPDFQRPDGDYDSWYIRNDVRRVPFRFRKLGCGRRVSHRVLSAGSNALAWFG